MNHKWKNASLAEVVKYNKYLLACAVILSIANLILTIALFNKEDIWTLVFADNIDRRLEVSNKQLYPSYLKDWGTQIARQVFITSPEEVVAQHLEIRKLTTTSKELDKFFAKQLAFVQGNRASSVFYVKQAKPVENGVYVSGTLHYWFAGSDKSVALEKAYVISYKQAARGLILLSNIEEVMEGEND